LLQPSIKAGLVAQQRDPFKGRRFNHSVDYRDKFQGTPAQ
jgi:hypothetical protein